MKHALRKYLSQRGSALFMVLSLMTALMVLVMAMYFSVVASRDVQYKVFYQEQSYRSATSLADAIISGLNGDKWNDSGAVGFRDTILGMQPGDSISTNGNNFAAFLGTGNDETNQLGAYTVDVTCLGEENNALQFDLAITVSVGGVIDTTHAFFQVNLNVFEPEGSDQTFASTGYAPNDSYVDGGVFNADVFYNNEYTVVGGYGSKALELNGDVSAGGSLKVEYLTGINPIKPATWSIRNTLYYDASQSADLSQGGTDGLMMIGGDFYLNGASFKNCDIYVLGDFHMSANMGGLGNDVRLFVNGDVYIEGAAAWAALPSTLYCKNVINNTSSAGNRSFTFATWDNSVKDALGDDVMTPSEMANKLDKKTKEQTFYKWVINSTKMHDDEGNPRADYIPELDTRVGASPNRMTIYFNDGNAAGGINATPVGTTVVEIPWDGGSGRNTAYDYFGPGEDLEYNAIVIDDVVLDRGGALQSNDLVLIIDTGDDPGNQVILKTPANRDFDGDGTDECFCWMPVEDYESAKSTVFMTVLIRGKGSVVINVPEGVTYQEMQFQAVMHETWFAIGGGAISNRADGATLYSAAGVRNSGAAATYSAFIHKECPAGCTQCGSLTVTRDTADCEKKFTDGTECNGKICEVYCARHEYTYKFCQVCEAPPEQSDPDDPDSYYGICKNRVDRDAVDAKIATLSGPLLSMTKDASGDTVYPTVNYFVVSSDESADICLSFNRRPDGTIDPFIENCMFGFVYAPYMTYKGYGGSSGGGYVRFLGGMVVSDYVFDDNYSMLNCMPEYLPKEMTSAANREEMALSASTGFEWKISLTGY